MTPALLPQGKAQQAFNRGKTDRDPFLSRARRCSAVTIPLLFRDVGANGQDSEVVPWQTLGAYGVNCLAAKLMLAMFPSGIPFIGLKAVKHVLQQLAQMDDDTKGKLKAEMDKGLSGVEQEFIDGVEEDGDRAKLFDMLRHIIVGGTHALKVNPNSTLQSIPLEQFVCWRDKSGNLFEFAIEDPMVWDTLPSDVQEMCKDHGYKIEESKPNQTINVYTHGKWKAGQWHLYQECWGQIVPGSEWTYNAEAMPYMFVGMNFVKGEHYSRSYCEDYEGDLQTLDANWQVLTEGGAAIARLVWAAKPGGTTNKKAFQDAANGAVITGDAEDITAIRSDKQGDLSIVVSQTERLEARLEKVFVINSAVQRNGERVTAEEIRFLIQELETTLGGVYANLINSIQAPYARLKLDSLQRTGRVTKLPKNTVKVTILTGDAALGRHQKAQTLDEFLERAGAVITTLGTAAAFIDVGNYLSRGASNRSIDADGLIKSQEKVDQETAQAHQMALAQQVAPEVVRQGGQMLQNQQQQQPPAEPAQAA